jgi:hypothetical protein
MKLSEAQAAQAITLLNVGWKQKDVAIKFGCSKPTIWKIARRAGIRKNNVDPLSDQMEQRVIQLAREGHGEPMIARTLAIPGHRVRPILRRLLLARTGTTEPREQLSLLEERLLRSKQRQFEQQMADEFSLPVDKIKKLLRRRNV